MEKKIALALLAVLFFCLTKGQHTIANVTLTEMFFSSPGYIDGLDYGHNMTRDYRFHTTYPGHNLRLEVVEFELEPPDKNGNCLYDKVLIYDGYNESASTFQVLCGTIHPGTTYTSSRDTVYVVFTSDDSNNYKGFQFSIVSDGLVIVTTTAKTTSTVQSSSKTTSALLQSTTTFPLTSPTDSSMPVQTSTAASSSTSSETYTTTSIPVSTDTSAPATTTFPLTSPTESSTPVQTSTAASSSTSSETYTTTSIPVSTDTSAPITTSSQTSSQTAASASSPFSFSASTASLTSNTASTEITTTDIQDRTTTVIPDQTVDFKDGAQGKDYTTWVIVGCCVVGFSLLVLLCAILYRCLKKKGQQKTSPTNVILLQDNVKKTSFKY